MAKSRVKAGDNFFLAAFCYAFASVIWCRGLFVCWQVLCDARPLLWRAVESWRLGGGVVGFVGGWSLVGCGAVMGACFCWGYYSTDLGCFSRDFGEFLIGWSAQVGEVRSGW